MVRHNSNVAERIVTECKQMCIALGSTDLHLHCLTLLCYAMEDVLGSVMANMLYCRFPSCGCVSWGPRFSYC